MADVPVQLRPVAKKFLGFFDLKKDHIVRCGDEDGERVLLNPGRQINVLLL